MDSGQSYSRPVSGIRAGRVSLLHSLAMNAPFVQMNGRSSDIALACFYLTMPLTALIITLLGLIYTHQITHEDGPFPQLPVTNIGDDPHSIYVTLSSTFIVFISSWMSSLAPVLAGFAVGLAVYHVGQKLLHDTRQSNLENLPTPYQLALTLRFINGSTWTGLWLWILYRLGWRKRPQPQSRSLTSIVGVVTVTGILGIAIFGADTWLHISTTTVSFTQVTNITDQHIEYSLGLLTGNCTSTNNSIAALASADTICGLDLSSGLMINSTEPIRTLNDFSDNIAVQLSSVSGLQYLTPSSSIIDPLHDFSAISYGARTQCTSLLADCSVQKGSNVTFDCNNGSFTGDLLVPNSGAFFQLLSFADRDMSVLAMNPIGLQNTFYTAVAALMAAPGNGEYALASDPEIVALNGAFAFVFLCNTTLLDIQYNVVNGTTIKLSGLTSNVSVANAFAQPLVNSAFGNSNLNTALEIGAQSAKIAQDLADVFASAFAKVTLSAGVQGISARSAAAVQQRRKILVAKIPYAPIYALVVASSCFIVVGVGLAFAAMRTPSEAREVQTRLSITGLVADRFEGRRARVGVSCLDHMFEEYEDSVSLRVGIDRSEDGGYAYRILHTEQDLEGNGIAPDVWHDSKLQSANSAGWI